MDKNESIEQLIARYLANNCTPAEIRRILHYFNQQELEGELRQSIQQHLRYTKPEDPTSQQAVDEVYEELLAKIDPRPTVKNRTIPIGLPGWTRVAAVWLALILSLGGILFVYQHFHPTRFLAQQNRIVTKPGERKTVRLEDGSVVWLNAASTLEFPTVFDQNSREVRLEGEAYFEVARQPERPFIIHSGQLQTKVLGTSFNISAYLEDSKISVAVLTGKVQVMPVNQNHPILLTPNQQAVYDKGEQNLSKHDSINATGLTSWKQGKLQFRNTLFPDVTLALQRNYGVTITYDNQLKNCPVYADFNQNESIDKILDLLAISLNGEVKRLGTNDYYLQGKGCF